jgi:hypothetical protein
MSKYKAIVGISENTKDFIEPYGLTSLKLTIEKNGENQFFRQKISGSIDFSESLFAMAKPLEDKCCIDVPISIFRSCNNSNDLFIKGQFKTSHIDWDFDLCSAKVNQIDLIDDYKSVYLFWNKKINLCSIPKNKTLEYTYRSQRTVILNGQDDTVNDYTLIQNNSGVLFAEWVLYAINKTFFGTKLASIVPSSVSQLSEFFSLAINPATGSENIFLKALIFQSTDLMFPIGTKATGLLEDGRINESISLSLKEVLETLKNVFDLHWHIDQNGIFKIEHISYFLNGLTYSTPQVGLDLREARFSKHLENYKYSYKIDADGLFGVEELRLTNNEAISKSKQAASTISVPSTIQNVHDYFFAKIDDFEFGNIKFNGNCASVDEKGETKKLIKSDDNLITNFEAVRMADESVEVTKWVLLDVENKDSSTFIVRSKLCERAAKFAPNAGFSASAIMRDFHRWNKPFESGIMNYSDTPSGMIGKGYNRNMHSVQKIKNLKKISIPFCCSEATFNPHKNVILPNGDSAVVIRADFDVATETLNLDLAQNHSCGFDVTFPANTTGANYPIVGTLLDTITIDGTCEVTEYINEVQVIFNRPITGIRKIYADGSGGSYNEDIMDVNTQC